MNDQPRQSLHAQQVRRIDVELRSRLPHLTTRIFEILQDRYLIWFDRALANAEDFSTEFRQEVRYVTVPVELTNELPASFIREWPTIRDVDLGKDFAGLSLTEFGLTNLIAAKFPDFKVRSIGMAGTTFPWTLEVNIETNVNEMTRQEVLAFCNRLGLPCKFSLAVRSGSALTSYSLTDPMHVVASARRKAVPEFVRQDEAFWFDSLDSIFRGTVPPEQFLDDGGGSRCLVDCQVGEPINLRQALLMYDVIYIGLPLAENHEAFLANQKLDDDDLLLMAAKGRLRAVSLQPEERLRVGLLERLAEARPGAILGRRKTAALMLSDLVRTASEYTFARPELAPDLYKIGHELADSDIEARNNLNVMLWPVTALRRSLATIHERASKGFPAIGVATILAKTLDGLGQDDRAATLKFLTCVLSERVQLAHALDATALPSLWEDDACLAIMNMQGDLLNFYRSFNGRIAAAWIGEQQRKAERRPAMPTVPLFDFPVGIPVLEVLNVSSFQSTRGQGLALMDRLAGLPDVEREAEVGRLDDAMRRRNAAASGRLLSLESLDEAMNLASLVASFLAPPPLLAAFDLTRKLGRLARRSRKVDSLMQAIEEDIAHSLGKNQDITFLSRVDRVARLRRRTVH